MNNHEEDELQAVREQLVPEARLPASVAIPSDRIRHWMKSRSLDVQGAVFDFVMDSRCVVRIVPCLEFEDYRRFVPNYLLRCLVENPQGEWAATRAEAGYELLRWFRIIWADHSVEVKASEEIKRLLGALCLDYTEEVRRVAIQEVLEHLFEDPSVREFFKDWKDHDQLREVYDEACEWRPIEGRSSTGP